MQVVSELGDGGQARVFKAHPLGEPENLVALKVFNSSAQANQNNAPQREFEILSRVRNCPNVIKVLDYLPCGGQIMLPQQPGSALDLYTDEKFMTLELCEHGDLFDLVSKVGPVRNIALLKKLFFQICNGLDALHTTA